MNNPHVSVVLVRPQGSMNLGLVARASQNLGVDELRLVQPTAEPSSDEAKMFANHAAGWLAEAPQYDTLSDAIADMEMVVGTSAAQRKRRKVPNRELSDIRALVAQRKAKRVALVFGNEADGLHNDELEQCQWCVQLSTPGPYPSYNLSHAVAITLYGLLSQPLEIPSPEDPLASREEIQQLIATGTETLRHYQYFRRAEEHRFMPKLRQMVERLALTQRDIRLLRGVVAQLDFMYEKLNQGAETTPDSDKA